MTLTQLRAFLSAARRGTFTAAAHDLQLAQASVSELIRRMEEECGLQLFVRGGRRLTLTTAGRELLPYAERAVSAVDHGQQALAAVGSISRGTVTIGLMRNWPYYGLQDLVPDFHRAHPGVRLRIVGQSSTEIAAAIAGGELEAGVVVLPVDDAGLKVTPLIRDELLYACSAAQSVRGPMTVTRMSQLPLVLYDASYGWLAPTRRQLFQEAQRVGVRLEPIIELERVESVLPLVQQGVGATVLPATIARSTACPPGVQTMPFEPPMHDTIAYIRRESGALSPAAWELAKRASDAILHNVADPTQRLRTRSPIRRL